MKHTLGKHGPTAKVKEKSLGTDIVPACHNACHKAGNKIGSVGVNSHSLTNKSRIWVPRGTQPPRNEVSSACCWWSLAVYTTELWG